jgi:Fe2+ or Zn2+ uptake regulation protein
LGLRLGVKRRDVQRAVVSPVTFAPDIVNSDGTLMSLERNGMNGTEEPISTSGLADRLRRVGQRVTPQRLVILGALRDLGLVSMTDLGGGARQFELIDDLHHHLICHRCGAILELDDALVDPLRDGIRARYGFAPAIDHLAVFGFCAVCARVTDSHGDRASGGRR